MDFNREGQQVKPIPSAETEPTIADMLQTLRLMFPHGHDEFNPITLKEMKLHSEKNYDYAAGGDPLGNFNRVATILRQYKGLSLSDPTVIALVYAMKQVDAALWMLSQKREGKIEDVNSRLGDVSVYIKLAMILHKQGDKPVVNTTETWKDETRKEYKPKPWVATTPVEHVCWGGYSDGDPVLCVREKPQRNYRRYA